MYKHISAGVDWLTSLNPNAAQSANVDFYLPPALPASTYLLNMTTGGVIGYDTNTYVTGTPWTGLYLPLGGGTLTGNLTLSTHNIVTDTTTGTDIGTATTQKVGFYGVTPVVQQTGNVCTALQNLGLVASCTESGGSGANAALSNLSSVAINLSLLPGATNSISLGNNSYAWNYANIQDANSNSFLSGIPTNLTGLYNVNLGHLGLFTITSGSFNTNVGYEGLFSNTSAFFNTNIGQQGLINDSTGQYNSNLGMYGLYDVGSGSYNTGVGYFTAFHSGTHLRTISYSTFLGANATSTVDGVTDSTAVGDSATVTASHQIVIGASTVTQTIITSCSAGAGAQTCWATGGELGYCTGALGTCTACTAC
jgi:hypothetical protein